MDELVSCLREDITIESLFAVGLYVGHGVVMSDMVVALLLASAALFAANKLKLSGVSVGIIVVGRGAVGSLDNEGMEVGANVGCSFVGDGDGAIVGGFGHTLPVLSCEYAHTTSTIQS